jgi:hypothetical protein
LCECYHRQAFDAISDNRQMTAATKEKSEYVRGSFARSIRTADRAGFSPSVQTVRSLDGRGQAPASFLLTGPAACFCAPAQLEASISFPALPLACGCPIRRRAESLSPFVSVSLNKSSFFVVVLALLQSGTWRLAGCTQAYYDLC